MTRLLAAAAAALLGAIWIPQAHAAPQITSVTPASGPAAGNTIITIVGTGFGASGNAAMVGGKACTVTSESPEQIECTLPPGTGASRPIRVQDDTGQASPPYPFAYAAPAITNITADSFPTAGGVTITIYGENFGPETGSPVVLVNDAQACRRVRMEQDLFACRLPPGQGTDVPVDITVDGQTSSPATFSYDPPAITAVTPTRGPAAGGVLITLTGNNFGRTTTVAVGSTDCPIEAQRDDRVECMLPPESAGAPPDVQAFVGGQSSNAVPYSRRPAKSHCDAAKLKAAALYAQCLGKAESTAAKKGLDVSAEAITKCDDKFTEGCATGESKFDDCSQPGTCDAIAEATQRKGWDGTIHGSTR